MKRGRHLRRELWMALAVAVLLSAGGRADDTPAAEPAAEPAPIKEIKMFAENWKWTPNVIRVPQGTRLQIRIENIEAPHRSHGDRQLVPHLQFMKPFTHKDECQQV